MERIVATIFIVGFFSALPLWVLSKQRGWVTLLGTREGPAGPFQVTIVRRNAFSTSRDVLEVVGAHVDSIPGSGGGSRGYRRKIVLVLDTQEHGQHEVMYDLAPSTQHIPNTYAPIKARADLINEARDSGQTSFTIEIAPDLTFWLWLGITVVFAAAGLVIALVGGRSAVLKPE